MIFNELKQQGTEDFPFGYYHVDESHPKYQMAFHWHANLELVRVLKGKLTLFLDNRVHELYENEVAVINSETVHGATPSNCVYECIVFNLAFLKTGNQMCDGFIEGLLSHSIFLHERQREESVCALIHDIFREIAKKEDFSAFKVIAKYHALLGELQQKKQYASHLPPAFEAYERKSVKLKIVLKFIREHFASDITLDDMAAVAGFSRQYFCKFFKAMTSTTPIEYLTSYRVERAARMLLSTDLSVTQIAYDCGFNDLSYFIKTFKAFNRLSPKEYRRR